MSYSYIKSVFPNFENSNKVYDESLYSNLQESQVQQQAQAPLQEVKHEVKNEVKHEIKQEQQIVYPQISNSNNVGDFASNTFEKNQVQNNLRYYNIPISDEVKNIEYNNENKYKPYNIKENEYGMDLTEKIPTKEVKLDKLDKLEKFENINELGCDIYIKHVSECRKCREIVSRQFNMYDNEEVMEVISYLIFGLFILLAINSIKNN